MIKKLFIDCDPGLDDLVAIIAALQMPQVQVVGIASVAGNVPIEHTTSNIGRILELAARSEIPYAQGAGSPLLRPPVTAEKVHGETGIGSVVLPPSKNSPISQDGAAFLYQCARETPQKLTVAALGPLTNLALAFTIYPDLPGLLERVVIMGGAHAFGNVTPKAEFNIYADPHAAHIVFESGVPLAMVGLDATMAVGFTQDEFMELCPETPGGQAVAVAMGDILRYYTANNLGAKAYMHDLTAMLYITNPEVFSTLFCRVDIELAGSLTFGQTVCDVEAVSGKPPNVTLAMGVKEEEYRNVLAQVIARV